MFAAFKDGKAIGDTVIFIGTYCIVLNSSHIKLHYVWHICLIHLKLLVFVSNNVIFKGLKVIDLKKKKVPVQVK